MKLKSVFNTAKIQSQVFCCQVNFQPSEFPQVRASRLRRVAIVEKKGGEHVQFAALRGLESPFPSDALSARGGRRVFSNRVDRSRRSRQTGQARNCMFRS
jgi:hypothetical protein